MPQPSRRAAAIFIALLVAATLQVITQLATSSAAEAVPGRQRVLSAVLENTNPHKSTGAVCPNGTRVVGGGAWAFDNTGNKVHLTSLEPERFTVFGTTLDEYSAEAEAEPG